MGSVIGGDIGNVVDRVVQPLQHQLNFMGVATGFADPYEAKALGIDQGAFSPNEMEQAWNRQLQAQMQGQGPSVAELQMQRGLEQANKQAMGVAAAQRGVSPAQAARLASITQGQNAMQTNQQAGIMRAQEQIAASQVLGQGLQSQRAGRAAGQQLGVQQNLGIQGINLQGFEGRANRGNKTLENIGSGMATFAALGMANGGLVDPAMVQSAQSADQAFLATFANALGNQVGAAMATRVAAPQPQESAFSMSGILSKKLSAKADADAMAPALTKAFEQQGTKTDAINPQYLQPQNQLPLMPGDPNAGQMMIAQQPQLQFPASYLGQEPMTKMQSAPIMPPRTMVAEKPVQPRAQLVTGTRPVKPKIQEPAPQQAEQSWIQQAQQFLDSLKRKDVQAGDIRDGAQ